MATIALPRVAVLDDIERYFADAQPAALSQHVAVGGMAQQQQRMALARDALSQLKAGVVGQLRSRCGAAGACCATMRCGCAESCHGDCALPPPPQCTPPQPLFHVCSRPHFAASAVEPVDAALAARIMAETEELGDKSKRLAALRVLVGCVAGSLNS